MKRTCAMCNTIILIIALSLASSCFSYAQEEKGASQEVKGFSLVQYGDNGEKKWELNGSSAELEGDKVKIDEPSAVAFGEKTSLKLKAKQGNFDRGQHLVHLENNVVVKTTDGTTLTTDFLDWDAETRNVSTEALVSIKKSDFEVNGKGAVCDLESKTADLKKDITANITSLDSGILGATNESSQTTITCDGPLEINYRKNRATFWNNVKLEDVQGNVFADRIDVYFRKGARRIRCVVARGNVEIVNGENVTYSEKAIYLVEQGRVVLPKRPKLVIKNGTSK